MRSAGETLESSARTGHIMSCRVTGCVVGPTLVADAQSHVDALAIDGASVYWTQRGLHGVRSAIRKCGRDGCVQPREVFDYGRGGGPTALAVDDDGVYWADSEDRALERCPVDGCGGTAPEVLARARVPPGGLTIAQGILYWTNDDGSVMKCPSRGCDAAPTTLGAALGHPAEVAVEGAKVIWVNHRVASDAAGDQTSEILSCPVSGCAGSPEVLVRTDLVIGTVASHAGSIYWTERGGGDGDAVRTCAIEHCLPSTMATAVVVDHLSVSDAGIFWSEARKHQIQMLALPRVR